MPKAHDIGRLYVQRYRYPVGLLDRPPRWELAATTEVEEPYRLGKGVCVRLTAHWGVVIGWWGLPTRDEVGALYGALRASDMAVPIEEIVNWSGPEGGSDVVPVCPQPQPAAAHAPDSPCGSPSVDPAGVRTFHF